MSKIKLSNYIAKRLKEVYGINHFFMVSGGGAMHLNDSLGRFMPYTANHHEQACSIAAEGYARINQKMTVVNVTTGPGGLNCLNGVFGQWTDSVPVLYLSGQVKFSTTLSSCTEIPLRQLGDQEVDIISVVKPLTKFAEMVVEPNKIKYCLDKAIYEATTGRMGPVWLDIPMNVQGAMIEEDDLEEFIAPCEKKQDLKINDVLEKLKNAKCPLIIAGHGIRLSGQLDNFRALIEGTDIPVVTTFNGFDILESDNKNYVGRIGTIGQRSGNFALQNADVILCLGTRNNIRQASYNWENYAKNAFKIVVDIDDAELEKPTVVPDMKILADLKNFIPILKDNMPKLTTKDWLRFCKELQNKYCFENTAEYQQEGNNINVYNFVHILTESMTENDILTAANGSACVCLFQTGVVKKGQRIFWNSGNASMGYDLPAAIGASLEAQNRNVICLAGDGSIMMNIQELQTILYNNLPIKIFIINNSGYSSIRQTQRNFFNGNMTGSDEDSGISMPDFCKLASGFGLKSVLIENPKQMQEQIKEVMTMQTPVVCEVVTQKEYSFTPKLSARKLEDGTMISPSLEDMYPFIDRNEFCENKFLSK